MTTLKIEKSHPVSDKKDTGYKPKKPRVIYGKSFEEILREELNEESKSI